MKKIVNLVLTGALALSLTACSDKEQEAKDYIVEQTLAEKKRAKTLDREIKIIKMQNDEEIKKCTDFATTVKCAGVIQKKYYIVKDKCLKYTDETEFDNCIKNTLKEYEESQKKKKK